VVRKSPSSGSAAVAGTYRQLRALEHQPAGANPLGALLTRLTRRLQLLAAGPLGAEGTRSRSPAHDSRRAVASLVRRIQLLRRLLVHLARIDPSHARSVAPALGALDRLLAELLHAQIPISAHDLRRGPGPDGRGGPVGGIALAEPPGSPIAPPAVTPTSRLWMATATLAADRGQALDRATGRHDASARPPTFKSAAQRQDSLLTTFVALSGPSGNVGAGGTSAGTGAGVLVNLCAVCLLLGLLADRLTFAVLPWRLAVVGYRLERPG